MRQVPDVHKSSETKCSRVGVPVPGSGQICPQQRNLFARMPPRSPGSGTVRNSSQGSGPNTTDGGVGLCRCCTAGELGPSKLYCISHAGTCVRTAHFPGGHKLTFESTSARFLLFSILKHSILALLTFMHLLVRSIFAKPNSQQFVLEGRALSLSIDPP